MEKNWIAVCAGKCLEMTADIGDDGDEVLEVGNTLAVDLVSFWPVGGDEHAGGPAERLPDGFGYEWRKGVEQG